MKRIERSTLVFFRNDDVNAAQPGLFEVTELFLSRMLPLAHAIEPANLKPDVAEWLLDLPEDQIELIQHGFSHETHDRGEFGGNRSAIDQKTDLLEGKRILEQHFGARFFPAISFPFNIYNAHSMRILDELGFKVASMHYNAALSRRIVYRMGHVLNTGLLPGDRHVSYHLEFYPGTRVLEVSGSISPIRTYVGGHGGVDCVFTELEALQMQFRHCQGFMPVVGIVLHHRYHSTPERREIIERLLDWLTAQPDVKFASLKEIDDLYRERIAHG